MTTNAHRPPSTAKFRTTDSARPCLLRLTCSALATVKVGGGNPSTIRKPKKIAAQIAAYWGSRENYSSFSRIMSAKPRTQIPHASAPFAIHPRGWAEFFGRISR